VSSGEFAGIFGWFDELVMLSKSKEIIKIT